jgi:hypothetical protein
MGNMMTSRMFCRVGQQHHDAVDPCGTATVGGCTVLERVDHAAEPLAHFVLAIACDFKRFEHDFRAVVSDRAGHQFIAVTGQIILEPFDLQRVAVQGIHSALGH